MSSILDLLPIITIIAIGGGIWQFLSKFTSLNFRKTEYYNLFLFIGTSALIIPLTWIGIQPNGILKISSKNNSVLLIDFRGWCMLYFFIGLIVAIIAGYVFLRKFLNKLEDFRFEWDILRDYRILLLIFLLIDYFILTLILPLRGFDALYYYFPEAEVFYQANRITEINYLSFLPVVKSPLNVLLYVYSYYITEGLAIQIIPFIFLLGIVLLVYDFSIEFFDNKKIGLLAAVFTLTLPLTYWLMNYWAFYQDLYLCYYFSITCYFSLKWYKSPSNFTYGLFISLGVIISLLTKINAWILPIILILWLPTEIKGKLIRLIMSLTLGIFLIIQSVTRIFIGAALPIIIAIGGTIFFLIKERSPIASTHAIFRQVPIFLGTIIGSFWLNNRISLSSSVWEEIYNSYFRLQRAIKWVYPQQPQDPLMHSIETVHSVNFISAIGILLLGSCFVLTWLILKAYALKRFSPITPPLIWILVFFGIWSTYYLTGSIRYLTPIIIPIILCIAWGLYQITNQFDDKTKQEFVGILFAFLGCLSFYYLIPLRTLTISDQTQETIGLSYNQAALTYYAHPEILILIGSIISLLIFIIIRKDPLLSPKMRKGLLITGKMLLILTIIIPIAVQSFLLVYTKGDFNQLHAIHEYEYRPEYQDLVAVIQQQNQPLAGIMTVRTPGLQFFTSQPVIDIYYQRQFFLGDPFFTNNNLTELIEILRYPLNHTIETNYNLDLVFSIRFIVVPWTENLYYENYIAQIRDKSILYQALDNSSFIDEFTLIFENSDYQLYQVIFF